MSSPFAGVRTLTAAEFEPKLLNYYDRLRIRSLMREEYRAWGYAERANLEESLEELDRDPAARCVPFGAQAILGQLDADIGIRPTPQCSAPLLAEQEILTKYFAQARAQTDAGWRPIPLLLLQVETS